SAPSPTTTAANAVPPLPGSRRRASPPYEPPREEIEGAVGESRDDAEHHQSPHHLRRLHVLLRELDAISEAREGPRKLGTHQRVEGNAHRRAQADKDVGHGGRKHHVDEQIAFAGAERSSGA